MPGTELQWFLSVLPALPLLVLLWKDPTGRWEYYWLVVAALAVTAVGGALLLDIAAGSRSLLAAALSVVNKATLLFAGFGLSSVVYFNTPLTLTAPRLTVLVAASFVIGLAVDPLLALVLVVYPMLRREAPLQSVVAATIAGLLSGPFSWQSPGLLGHWVNATLQLPSWWLWTEQQAQVATLFALVFLLAIHWVYVHYWTNAPRRPTSLWKTLQSVARWDWIVFGTLLVALVAVQYLLPDIHDRMGKAFLYKLQGRDYLIREEWYAFVPWREVCQIAIGLLSLLRWESQKENKFSLGPVGRAVLVLTMLYIAATPAMTAVYQNRYEWPTVIRMLYDLLSWIWIHWDPAYVKAFAIFGVLVCVLVPRFDVLAMISHHGGITGASVVKNKGRLTPVRHVQWALLFGVVPVVAAIIVMYFTTR